MQKIPSIVDILWRYQQQEKLTELEKQVLESWLRESEAHEDLFDDLSNEEAWNQEIAALQAKDDRATWNHIRERIEAMQGKPVVRIVPVPWKKYAAVAAIFAGAIIGTYFLIIRRAGVIRDQEQSQTQRFKNDVVAATPQATLTLSDGKVIRLDTARTGKLNEANTIWKTDSNNLVLRQEAGAGQPEAFNTLVTPIGTRYQITLADGSRVWLNAGSSLRFPSTFSGASRQVILSGEGYFEIAKSKTKPFLVESGNGMIRVLGTRFNSRNYPGESESKTTLLEGQISFRAGQDSLLLRPGEQVSLTENGKISVGPVNTDQAVAWRKNLFWFQSESFENIMTELTRWYPVHVIYKGQVPQRFTGILPRSRSLIEVLKILELPGYVHFRISGNEVEVIPRKT